MTSQAKQQNVMRMLKLSIANSRKLSAKMDDYEQGITVNTVGDDRTTQDKLEDENYMGRDFRDKVYTLFNNDPKQSEAYIEKAKARGMTPQGFNVAYPQLVQLFKGTLASADIVFNNTIQLINNFEATGNTKQATRQSIAKSTKQMADIYDFLEKSYDDGLLSKSKGDKAADKLDDLGDILRMSPDQDIEQDIAELAKVARSDSITPEQKLPTLLKGLHGIKYSSSGSHSSSSKEESSAKKAIDQRRGSYPSTPPSTPIAVPSYNIDEPWNRTTAAAAHSRPSLTPPGPGTGRLRGAERRRNSSAESTTPQGAVTRLQSQRDAIRKLYGDEYSV